jgi:hypothetical protein
MKCRVEVEKTIHPTEITPESLAGMFWKQPDVLNRLMFDDSPENLRCYMYMPE